MHIQYQDLKFTHYWMFSTLMSQKENLHIVKSMIEVITKRKVEQIALQGTEHTEKPFLTGKGVRYDVKFVGDERVYIIEMQNYRDNIMHRSVVYHSVEKVKNFQSEKGYDNVVETIVIFICPYDYFKIGEAKYELAWREIHHPELNPYGGCTTILLNTSARSKDKALDAFLQYCKDGEVEDTLTKSIEEAVEKIKNNEEMMENYMRFEDYVQQERKEGLLQGKREICVAMLKEKLDVSVIEKTTGLSKEEILQIKQSLHTA